MKYIILLALCFIEIAADGQNPEKYVYKITANLTNGTVRFETGFKISGKKGIYTTLHGLVGAINITADQKGHPLAYEHLQISKVDIAHDIAVLSNIVMDNEVSNDGITPSQGNLQPSSILSSYGHPYGIDLIKRDDIKAADPAMVILTNRIPPNEKSLYLNRNSPDITKRIIELRYNFGNGESGEPILNQQKQVVGIVDGGFADINLSWAIPIVDLNLSSAFNMSQINSLANVPVKLHSYQIDVEQLSGVSTTDWSEKIESWYFGLLKLNGLSNTNGHALEQFDQATLSNRFKNVLNLDNGQSYTWFGQFFLQPPYGIASAGQSYPTDFIPVNIDKTNDNRQLLTVYLKYTSPLYMVKFKPVTSGFDRHGGLPEFTFNPDYYKDEPDVEECRMLNVQAVIVVDASGKLVDVKEVKTIVSNDPYFQGK